MLPGPEDDGPMDDPDPMMVPLPLLLPLIPPLTGAPPLADPIPAPVPLDELEFEDEGVEVEAIPVAVLEALEISVAEGDVRLDLARLFNDDNDENDDVLDD